MALNLIIKIYLAGIILNLLIIAYHLISDYKMISINLKGIISFLLLSWIIYPILFIKANKF